MMALALNLAIAWLAGIVPCYVQENIVLVTISLTGIFRQIVSIVAPTVEDGGRQPPLVRPSSAVAFRLLAWRPEPILPQ